jgi:hypothetical protein
MRRYPFLITTLLFLLGHTAAHGAEAKNEKETELHQAYGREYSFALRFTQQQEWRKDTATASSIGIGVAAHIHLLHLGPLAFGVEPGADFLFREGDTILPVELAFKGTFETHTFVEPYFGLGPVVSIDFGEETTVHYGGALSLGVGLYATHHYGFFVEGTYRWLGGHGFQQQLAFSLGPFVCF